MIALVGLMLSAPAGAQNSGTEHGYRLYSSTSEYRAYADRDDQTSQMHCYLRQAYSEQRSTQIMIGTAQPRGSLNPDDTEIAIIVTNDNWSAQPGATYNDIRIEVNGRTYQQTTYGTRLMGKNGIITKLPPAILMEMFNGDELIYRRNQDIFAQINTRNARTAIAGYHQCLADRRIHLNNMQRQREQAARINPDPFRR